MVDIANNSSSRKSSHTYVGTFLYTTFIQDKNLVAKLSFPGLSIIVILIIVKAVTI